MTCRPVATLVAALGLAACAAQPETSGPLPTAPLPPTFDSGMPSAATATPSSGRWWTAFGDPTLTDLIDQALARNNDLAAAAIKVRHARLAAGLAADKQRPTLDATVATQGSRTLSTSPATTGLQPGQAQSNSFTSSSAALSVSYEVDLWGRLASARDAQEWEAAATDQDCQSTALTLAGTTARLYWTIRYLDLRLALGRQDVDYARRTLSLVAARRGAGAVGAIEVDQARQDLQSQLADQQAFLTQREQTQRALAILFDGPPRDMSLPEGDLADRRLTPLSTGVPAALLDRRPDLRAAALRLKEYLATVDATRAGYLPTLSLSTSLAGSGTTLAQLLQNPAATLGANLVLPFLNWSQMEHSTALSQADYDQAVVAFRQSVYAAVKDVDDALSAERHDGEQGRRLEAALEAARSVEAHSEARYRAGAATLQSWLDAGAKRRSTEAALLANRLSRLDDRVTLYLALGGDAG
jgi:NodT family efflux transporter outer membrane factor (OMF) lipoprotein